MIAAITCSLLIHMVARETEWSREKLKRHMQCMTVVIIDLLERSP